MSVPSYDCYLDSGVEWLGAVPSHWSVVPLRSQFSELTDKNSGLVSTEYLSLVAGRGVMPYAEKGDIGNKRPDDLEKCKIVRAGNFVINSMNFGIGAFGVSAYDGVCSPVYVILRPNEKRSLGFLRWIFDNPGFRQTAQSYGNGILAHRSAIGWDELRAMPAAIPPLLEQAAIAAFLDRETGMIDALVEAQTRLIELLKEKRQAVISHAVTKGLDPAAPMKDSGVEWLGQVPAHWDVAPLKRYLELLSGYAFPSAGFSDDVADIRLLRGANIGVGRIRWDDVVYWPSQEGLEQFSMRPGDIVMGMDRPWIADGLRIAQISEEDAPCLLLQRVAALRPNDALRPRHLLKLLMSEAFYHHCAPNMTGVSVPHISPTQVGDFVVAMPPSAEQQLIEVAVRTQTDKLAALMAEAEVAISLLQERRAALISAAVTGKIDVRGAVQAKREAA